LRDTLISSFDLDWIFEITERESERMEEPVVRFRDPFSDRIVRKMAIIANGNVVMA